MNKPFLILFTIGSVLIMAFSIYKTVQANGASAFSFIIPAPDQKYAEPIMDTLAYDMFMDYHQSSTPGTSKGVLRTGDEAIVQFYVDEAQLIEPLRSMADSLGLEFKGLSAIPAYNKADSSNTLIWVAVVDTDPGDGVVLKLMLPDQTETWSNYIYDHGSICPKICPENSSWLWNKEWAE